METVDYDNLLVYTGYTIGKVLRGDTQWYTMDMASDITTFMVDVNCEGTNGTP